MKNIKLTLHTNPVEDAKVRARLTVPLKAEKVESSKKHQKRYKNVPKEELPSKH